MRGLSRRVVLKSGELKLDVEDTGGIVGGGYSLEQVLVQRIVTSIHWAI